MIVRLRDWVEVINAEDLPEDTHGNDVPDWAGAPGVMEQARVESGTSTELVVAGETVTTRYTIHLLPTTTATAASKIRWRGDLYTVEGDLPVATDLMTRVTHVSGVLTRFTG